MEIAARNVDEAWALFHVYTRNAIESGSMIQSSPRGVRTLEFPYPVTTVYHKPEECVLTDPVRDANPFFHLYESLWMLAGRRDVERVKYYSSQISAYSDDQINFHGAYGHRWVHHFNEGDQIEFLIRLLRKDPDTRRAVLGMWNPNADMEPALHGGLDVPCNVAAFFRVRNGYLDMTVANRSNDAVWGCYGANAVHFSFLLQHVARMAGFRVGAYVQMSNSLHVYLDGKPGEVWQRCYNNSPDLLGSHEPEGPMLPHDFTRLQARMVTERPGPVWSVDRHITESIWLAEVAVPMLMCFALYKNGEADKAVAGLRAAYANCGDEWLKQGALWVQRRVEARAGKEVGQR